ncbi:hypothetical protein ABT297_38765 [Dactylosporangium sp. NPDC000555]|uniref:hypothetical protein n=1 Tax=Dactylosporangium sp. NPDC000555 TaxID=3154260 RepID=UPI00331CBAC9
MSSAHEDTPNTGPAHPAAPEPTPPAPPTGGPGVPVLRSSRLKLGIVAAVSAVIVVGGGVAVAQAATGSSAVQDGRGPGGYGGPSGNGQDKPGGKDFQGHRGFGRGGAGAFGGMLHGDFVVKKGDGQYVTHRLQTGTVTAVSATSITAKSEDGHATTFVVGESTRVGNGTAKITDVKTGDTVTIVGLVSGDTATATRITDLALMRQRERGNGGSDQHPEGKPRPSRTS